METTTQEPKVETTQAPQQQPEVQMTNGQQQAPTPVSNNNTSITTSPEKPKVPAQPKAPIIRADESGLNLTSMDEMWRFAVIAQKSGIVPKNCDTPEKVFIVLQTGLELGLKPMQSMKSLGVINGIASLYGDGALAQVMKHPDFEYHKEWITGTGENMTAHCQIKRKGHELYEKTFSWAQAKKANLTTKKGPWQEYPDRQLQMRCRSFCMRDKFADALMGVPIYEEVQDYPLEAINNQPQAQAPSGPKFDEEAQQAAATPPIASSNQDQQQQQQTETVDAEFKDQPTDSSAKEDPAASPEASVEETKTDAPEQPKANGQPQRSPEEVQAEFEMQFPK